MQYNNPTYYEIRGGDGEVEASSESVVREHEKRKRYKKGLHLRNPNVLCHFLSDFSSISIHNF